MVLFNGDRVFIKEGETLRFGRYQEYMEEQYPTYPSHVLKKLQEYQDFRSPSVVSPRSKAIQAVFDNKYEEPKKTKNVTATTTSATDDISSITDDNSSSNVNNNNSGINFFPGLTSPIVVSKKCRVRRKNIPPGGGGATAATTTGNDGDDNSYDVEDGEIVGEGESSEMVLRRQIVWDDNKGHVDLKTSRFCDDEYKVVDRKFTVGQHVYRRGLRGKVTEIIPIATVKIHPFESKDTSKIRSGNVKNATPHVEVITELSLDDLQPVSTFFNGVNIEFKGWIGQIVETSRTVTYKLASRIRDRDTFQWNFFDSHVLSIRHKSQDSFNKGSIIPKSFSYPFLPHGFSNPYKGKVERLSKRQLEKQVEQEEDEKENLTSARNQINDYDVTPGPRQFSESLLYNSPISPSTPTSSKKPTPLSLKNRRKTGKSIKDPSVIATVESVSVVSIKVRWTGKLPTDLIKLTPLDRAMKTLSRNKANNDQETPKMPPTFICGKDLKSVRTLYINPAMYFNKKGLCKLSTNKTVTISEKKWAEDLYKSLASPKDFANAPFDLRSVTFGPPSLPRAALRSLGKDSSSKSQRKENDDDCFEIRKPGDENTPVVGKSGDEQKNLGERENDVIVCKHSVRNMYKVIWEQNLDDAAADNDKKNNKKQRKSYLPGDGGSTVGLYYGSQLEPDVNQVHKLCLGLIHSHLYVVSKEGMKGKWDYGVVIDKPTDDSVVVEWLKIRVDGSVVTVCALQCPLVEIDKHPTFNELHEGRIVVRRKEAAKYKSCKMFRFGTIVSVQRFSLGQISVYCPIQKQIICLWPHMLEVCAELPMHYLIANNLVGLNKSH